jgi:hypothetical protein
MRLEANDHTPDFGVRRRHEHKHSADGEDRPVT